ncbi:hypothetical protein OBBRIDRAFT_797465 [Obba rivulosa]|uniref:Golgi apparatus membrane protein TVP38 n=1 Tax=Obba rivulosa TaxID=1052685 RepID=A0A8E2DFN8_9APHY|nr:hypothetical protein OBBRIDRAFT_797465 [Obba rivulosa]
MPHSYQPLKDDGQTIPMAPAPSYAYTDPHLQKPLESRSSSPPPSVSFRELSRTPSPTPSENEALHPEPFDPSSVFTKKFWFSKSMIVRVIIITISVGFALMFTVFRKQIANGLRPAANSIHKLPAGFLIPIAIMVVLSFPPLFGQEIIAIMCGLVWGLWGGFAIVSAGTLLGEVISFLVFRYACATRTAKLEQKNLTYACLAKVVQHGGFKIVLVMRYSAIPSHFTTAIFAACGVSMVPFVAAAVLSLPKQLVTVYLGFTLSTSADTESKADKIVENVVLVLTILATVFGMAYIKRQIKAVMPDVVYARRKARQAKLGAGYGSEERLYSSGGV